MFIGVFGSEPKPLHQLQNGVMVITQMSSSSILYSSSIYCFAIVCPAIDLGTLQSQYFAVSIQ